MYFETQSGSSGKNTTLGPPAGNQIHDSSNLVRCSANLVKKAAAENLAMSSLALATSFTVDARK